MRSIELGDDVHLRASRDDTEKSGLAALIAEPAQRPAGGLDDGAARVGEPGEPEQLGAGDPTVGGLGDETAIEQSPKSSTHGWPWLTGSARERRGRRCAGRLSDRDEDIHRSVERDRARDAGNLDAHYMSSLDH